MEFLNFVLFLEAGTTTIDILKMRTRAQRGWVTCPSHPTSEHQKLDFEPRSGEPQSLCSLFLHYAVILSGLKKKKIPHLWVRRPRPGSWYLSVMALDKLATSWAWFSQLPKRGTGQIWVCGNPGPYAWNSTGTIWLGPYGICSTSS